jgi:glutathione S-transferase
MFASGLEIATYKLYHQPLCPFSRKVRILLAAKGIGFELVKENFWERRKEFIAINTMGTVPVLFDQNNGNIICCSQVIVEYIEEKYAETKSFIGNSLVNRAEARRLQTWFDEKFYNEVSKYILHERFYNRFLPNSPAPNSNTILIAKQNLNIHLRYMSFLLETRKYLAGSEISIADFAAAGHISTLDYFGDVNWRNYELVKEWYISVKSQKGFLDILKDKVPSITPPEWYGKFDF